MVTLFSGETISEKNCVALEPWEIGRIDGDKMSSKLEEQYDGMYIKVIKIIRCMLFSLRISVQIGHFIA